MTRAELEASAWMNAALSLAIADPDLAATVADQLARRGERTRFPSVAQNDRNAAALIRWAIAPPNATMPVLEGEVVQ